MLKRNDSNSTIVKLSIGLILVFSVISYLYYPYIQDYSTTPKWAGLSIILLIFIPLTHKRPVYLNLTMLCWLLFLTQYLAQSFRSYNFWEATSHALPFLIAPITVITLLRLSENFNDFYKNAGTWLGLILAPIAVYTLFELIGLILSGSYTHQSTYEFRYTFGHRNQFSHVLTLAFPIIFMGMLSQYKKWLKITLSLVMLIIVLDIVLLQNRASMLVLCVYLLFGIAYWFLYKKEGIKKRLLIGLGTFFTASILLFIIKPSAVKSLFETNYGSGNERVRIWKNSWELIREQPFMGHGSGDWKIEILRFPSDFTQAETGLVFFQRAHNDFIQITAENGLIGLLTLLVFFIVATIKIVKSELEMSKKYIVLAGLSGFLTISNLSFPMEKIELLILLFLLLMPANLSKNNRMKLSPVLVSLIGLMVIILGLTLSSVKLHNENSYAQFKSSNQIKYLEELDDDFYTIDPISTPIQWHMGNHFFGKNQFSEAIHHYQLALAHNPYHIHLLNNLASSLVKTEMIDSAMVYYQKALDINPTFTETLMNLASLTFNSGDIDGALGHILKVKIDSEPESYRTYIAAIGQAKCRWLVELYDEPEFEQFLIENDKNASLFYDISIKSRQSSASFEDELRLYFQGLK